MNKYPWLLGCNKWVLRIPKKCFISRCQSTDYSTSLRRILETIWYKQSTEKKDNDWKTKEAKVKACISCGVCSETTHGNLLGCPEFQKYIPGQPGGSISTPKEVCLKCLGTVFRNCLHNSLRYYKKYFCNIGKRHFMVCKCRKHENAHDWMRVNYDPKRGLKNMDEMYNEIRTIIYRSTE